MQIGRIVATPRDSHWSQIYTTALVLDDDASKTGFIVVAGISSEAEQDIAGVGRELFAYLENRIIRADLPLGERLPRVLENAGKACIETFEQPAECSLSAVVVNQNGAHFAQAGGGAVALWRRGELYIVLPGTEELEFYSAGLLARDIAVLATDAFVEGVSRGEVTAALANGSVSEAVEALSPKVHADSDDGKSAAAFIALEPADVRMRVAQKSSVAKQGAAAPPAAVPTPDTTDQPQDDGLDIRERIKNFTELWSFPSMPRRDRKTSIYLDGGGLRDRRTLGLIIGLLAIVLGVSLWQGMLLRQERRRQAEIGSLLSQAESQYREALTIRDFNPERSQDLVQEADSLYTRVQEKQGQPVGNLLPWLRKDADGLSELEQTVDSLRTMSEEEPRSVFDERFDLASLGDNFEARSLTFLAGEPRVLSRDGRIAEIDIKAGIGQEIIEQPSDEPVDLGAEFVLTEQRIERVTSSGAVTTMIQGVDDWNEPAAVWSFTGNLYVLDSAANRIHKYVAIEGGYSNARNYIVDATDISDAVDFAIDGSIWIATSNGEVLVYSGGQRDELTVTGLEEPLSGELRIYTDFESELVYILDRGNRRVVVLNKSGELEDEFHASQLSEALDLFVDGDGTLWVLTSTHLLSI